MCIAYIINHNFYRYIFNQISSVITGAHLEKIFEQRRNYDLRRLLGSLI